LADRTPSSVEQPAERSPWAPPPPTPGFEKNPYQVQVDAQLAQLAAEQADTRGVAIENLALMRAYQAADQVAARLADSAADVRREAATCLGRVGSRRHLERLLSVLDDGNWGVRQAAWVSLLNLTSQEFPFDTLASPTKRAEQIAHWRQAVASLRAAGAARDFASLSSSPASWLRREQAAKALGAIGENPSAAAVLTGGLKGYTNRESNDRAERLFVQACIRSVGRLGGTEARAMLIALLDNPCWAVYAADALGDVGGEEAAVALLRVLPDYAYPLDRADKLPALHHGDGHSLVKKRSRNDVDFSGGGKIWTPRTAYAILLSLCRIEFSSPRAVGMLRQACPVIVANMPLDYDGISVYGVEPWEPISAFLLERAGLRQAAVDAAFMALGCERKPAANVPYREQLVRVSRGLADKPDAVLTPFASKILLSSCRVKEDIPLMISLLEHRAGWVRINAAKTLTAMGAKEAVGPISRLLETAKDDADYGYFGGYGRPDWKPAPPGTYGLHSPWYIGADEYNDPSPRYKEAFLRALGRLGGEECVPLLVRYLNSERNAMEIAYAAAEALADLRTPRALSALRRAESSHPIHNVRLVAREVLQQQGVAAEPRVAQEKPSPVIPSVGRIANPSYDALPDAIVFIKGPKSPPNYWFFSPTLQAYNQTDEGPTHRVGFSIYRLQPPQPTGKVTQLTHFTSGFVADLRVSFDGRQMLFARRGGESDPWWHLFAMNADGTGLRQLTRGPYHDVQPNFLPDGRIVFCTSRVGNRDEYHGYLGTGLAVMNADGSDIHCIGFNCGRDYEPMVNTDGRIVFVRLEDFYSLPKLEFILESCLPDGTDHHVLYGPERREFWAQAIAGKGSLGPQNGRHRTVCVSQPQPLDGKRFIINSFSGPMIVGPGRLEERILHPDDRMAITTPYPVGGNTLLCAAGERPSVKGKDGSVSYDFWKPVDHGLYWVDMTTGRLTLVYNDPQTSEFEARPLAPRPVPPVVATSPKTRQDLYTGRLFCASIYNTQEADVKERGRYVRIVEGLPMVTRHSTQTGGGVAWMNHGGSVGRVLGVLPVAPDGSFSIELPADRLIHIQVLDADGYVVGNELNWHYVRPGETKGCVGCHQKPNSVPDAAHRQPLALLSPPVRCLPTGGEMLYRAKNWVKQIDDENEERKRTVNAINVMGRL
jgi:HEAT repeat protein